jgi:hypothetical protein
LIKTRVRSEYINESRDTMGRYYNSDVRVRVTSNWGYPITGIGCSGCLRPSVCSTAMGYSAKLQKKVIQNQEALTSPKLACSFHRDSPLQCPLSYAGDPQLWVTITNAPDQNVWSQITNGTYVVHNVRRKPPSFDSPFWSAISLGSSLLVRPRR